MSDIAAAPSKEAPPASEEKPKGDSASADDGKLEGEKVEISKKELDQLKRDAARAASAQSELDVATKKLERYEAKGARKKVPDPENFSAEEQLDLARKINNKAFSDPDIRKAMESHPLLQNVLLGKNPLQLLSETEFLNVEDAFDQLVDHLKDELLPTLVKSGGDGGEEKGTELPLTEEKKPAAPAPAGTEGTAATKTEEEKKAEQDAATPGMDKVENSILAKAQDVFGKKGA